MIIQEEQGRRAESVGLLRIGNVLNGRFAAIVSEFFLPAVFRHPKVAKISAP